MQDLRQAEPFDHLIAPRLADWLAHVGVMGARGADTTVLGAGWWYETSGK